MNVSSKQLAESFSLALNPVFLLPVIILIALFLTPFPNAIIQGRWLGAILVANFLIPLWIIFYLDQRGIVLDDTLENKTLHRHRLIALLPIAAIFSVETAALYLYGKHEPLLEVFQICLLIMGLGGIISYFWKISAHALGLSATITLLTILLGPWALLGAFAVPFAVWSRLTLQRHTIWQLALGILLPPILVYLLDIIRPISF